MFRTIAKIIFVVQNVDVPQIAECSRGGVEIPTGGKNGPVQARERS